MRSCQKVYQVNLNLSLCAICVIKSRFASLENMLSALYPKVLQAVVSKHRDERAKVTDALVDLFTSERPMRAYIDNFAERQVREQAPAKGKTKAK